MYIKKKNNWDDLENNGEGHGNTTPVFLPGELHEQRSLAGYSPWSLKELDTTQRLKQRQQ